MRKNSSARMELFSPAGITDQMIAERAPCVMSDDDDRKKGKMTTIQPHEVKPGAMPPNASISRKLREFYDAVQEEGIPDRFLELLERLDQAEKNAKSVSAK